MPLQTHSIKFRLLVLLAVVLALSVASFGLFKEYDRRQARADHLERLLHETRLTLARAGAAQQSFFLEDLRDTNFFIARQSPRLEELRRETDSLEHLLLGLTREIPEQEYSVRQQNALAADFDAYRLALRSLIETAQTLGFKDHGLVGQMRGKMHQLEDMRLPGAELAILRVRRPEKDYQLRLDTAYWRGAMLALAELEALLKTTADPRVPAALSLCQQYRSIFGEMVKAHQAIGLGRDDGLMGTLKARKARLDRQIAQVEALVGQKLERGRSRATLIFLSLLALVLLTLLTLVWLVFRKVGLPIARLSESVHGLLRDGHDHGQLRTFEGRDEIAQLSRDFHELFTGMRSAKRQIQEQSHELLLQNNELEMQKEEILTQSESLQEANELVSQKNEQLKALLDEQVQMTRVVAHDLKTPLNNIFSILELLRETNDGQERDELFAMIFGVVESGSRLVQDLLDLGAVEEHRSPLRVAPLRLEPFLERLASAHAPRAEEKQIRLLTEFSLASPDFVSDEDYLRRVLENLLSNAVKFSPPGRRVWLKAEADAQRLVLRVKDEGPGFTPDDKRKIFGKFQRLSARPTGGEHSSGLGLSIVWALVQRLGGQIELESQVGQGSEFILRLPAHPAT